MHSPTSSALKVAPRDAARFDELSECVQRWVSGEAIVADVCNAVCEVIGRDPRPETVTAATAALPLRLREEVIDHLAGLRGARPEEVFSIRSLCGGEDQPRPPRAVTETAALISAVERWFDAP